MRIKEKATEQKQQREQVLKQIEEHRTVTATNTRYIMLSQPILFLTYYRNEVC